MNKNTIQTKATQIFNKINTNPNIYLIFGISTCNFCKKTLVYMKEKNLQYKYYEIDKYYEIFIAILEKLIKLNPSLQINPEHRTFPVIFYNKKFIGGYSDLIK